ncbi:hypothetical protein HMPREF3150_04878 [Pseudomonas aeruginosa]|nr:hypothetical protein HMPREF3150_04878 [Pseudomonas aeruginosa]
MLKSTFGLTGKPGLCTSGQGIGRKRSKSRCGYLGCYQDIVLYGFYFFCSFFEQH